METAAQAVVDHLCSALTHEGTPAVCAARLVRCRSRPPRQDRSSDTRLQLLAWEQRDRPPAWQDVLQRTVDLLSARGVEFDIPQAWPPAFDDRPTVVHLRGADGAALELGLPTGRLASVIVLTFVLPDGARILLMLGFSVDVDGAAVRLFSTLGISLRAALTQLTYRVGTTDRELTIDAT